MTEHDRHIRPLVREDMPALKQVIEGMELFPSEMLDEMANGFLGGGETAEFWLTYDDGNGPVALAYCSPERMTDGTWNLLLIAVDPRRHGQRLGAALMTHVERRLAEQGERILLVETSGLPAFERTRGFYHHIGYHEEARIRDYYQAGEDKIVFRKALSGIERG